MLNHHNFPWFAPLKALPNHDHVFQDLHSAALAVGLGTENVMLKQVGLNSMTMFATHNGGVAKKNGMI